MTPSRYRCTLIVMCLGLGVVVDCCVGAQGAQPDRMPTSPQADARPDSAQERWEVQLEPGQPNSELSPRYSPGGTRVPLRPTPIAGRQGLDALEGQLRLGTSIAEGSGQRFRIARGQEGGCYDLLFLDFDHDGSLDNEKPILCQPSRIRDKWWSNFSCSVQVKQNLGGTVIWQDYPLSLWVVVERPDETPQEIRFTRRGFLAGTVKIEEADYDVVLSDGNNDGLFGIGDFWTLQPLGAAPSAAPRRVGDFAWATGKAYRLEPADSTGTKAWIVRHDPGVTQTQDEQTRDRYAEDRAAPRAAHPLAFQRDVEQAIADAKAGKKLYFLDFEASWCGPCRQMNEIVYTTQAVVDAAQGIVCIKVDGDQRRDLVELYQVRGYPTGILLGPDGREMTRFVGYRDVRQMVAFLQAGRRTPDNVPAFIARLDTLRRDKSWSALEEEMAVWITSHPDRANNLRLTVAAGLSGMADPQAKCLAEKLLREVLATDSKSARALDTLAIVVGAGSRFDEAIELNRELLTVDPSNARAMNDLAWILSEEKGQYDEAMALAEKAVARNPANPHVLDTHGVVCFRLGRVQEAEKSLKDALRLMPPSSGGAVVTRYHLAEVYETMGLNAPAADLFQRSLNLHNGFGGLTSRQISHATEFLRQHPSSLPATASEATIPGTEGKPDRSPSETILVEADKLLRGTWGWDIDRGDDHDRGAVDLWWEQVNQRERYLVPRNGAQLAVIRDRPFVAVTLDDLRNAEFTVDRISASDAEPTIDVGTVLGVRTTEGNLVKVEVLGFDPRQGRSFSAKYDMRLHYVVYRTGASQPGDQAMVRQEQRGIASEAGQSANTGPSVPLNDAKLYESFQAGLAGLIESDKIVKIDALLAQLRRRDCSLALPSIPVRKMTWAELYQNCRNSVLVVGHLYRCNQCDQRHTSIAGGFAITASGVIATNHHVVNQPSSLAMGAMTADGRVYAVKEVLAADPDNDVAILQLDGSGVTPLALCPEVSVGTSAAMIDHPNRRFYNLSPGIISRYFTAYRNGREVAWIAATPPLGEGSSGAPLLNEWGAVVGMATHTHLIQHTKSENHQPPPPRTVNVFVPAAAVLRLIHPVTAAGSREPTAPIVDAVQRAQVQPVPTAAGPLTPGDNHAKDSRSLVGGGRTATELSATPARAGENANTTFRIPLEYSTELSEWGAGYYRPDVIRLSANEPPQNWLLPPVDGTTHRRFWAQRKFGHNTMMNIVVHAPQAPDGDPWEVFVTFGDELDFRTRQPVIVGARLDKKIEFDVAYGSAAKQPYAIRMRANAMNPGRPMLTYWRASIRKGTAEVLGRNYGVVLSDDNADGLYSDLAGTTVLLSREVDGRRTYDNRVTADSPIRIGQSDYFTIEISDDGSSALLRPAEYGILEGAVTQGPLDTAIPRARVKMTPYEFETLTDPNGRYEMRLPVGRYYEAQIATQGYIPEHVRRVPLISHDARANLNVRLDLAQAPRSGEMTLYDGDSFHFLSGQRHKVTDGDFYFSCRAGEPKFWANNQHQGGVMDLGRIQTPLNAVKPLVGPYNRFGVLAVVGHVYASLARQGEEDCHIIFRVTEIKQGESCTLTYYYRQPSARSHSPSRAEGTDQAISTQQPLGAPVAASTSPSAILSDNSTDGAINNDKVNAKFSTDLVVYLGCGAVNGPGTVVQIDRTGKVLGTIRLPGTPYGLAATRDGLVVAVPGGRPGRVVQIDSRGNVETLLEDEHTIPNPIAIAANPDSADILVADNRKDVLLLLPSGQAKDVRKVFQIQGHEKHLQNMSVAFAQDSHLLFGGNGPEGIYRVSIRETADMGRPVLSYDGAVAADPSSKRWAAALRNELRVFEETRELLNIRCPRTPLSRHGQAAPPRAPDPEPAAHQPGVPADLHRAVISYDCLQPFPGPARPSTSPGSGDLAQAGLWYTLPISG